MRTSTIQAGGTLQNGTELDCDVLAVTNLFPTIAIPARGAFVARQIAGVGRHLRSQPRVVLVGRTGAGGIVDSRRAVRDALRASPPNVIHVFYGLSGAALPVGRLPPTVLTLCGSDLLWGRSGHPRGAFEYAISILTAVRASAILVESQVLFRALPNRTLQGRAVVLPPGVDLETFRPLDRRECRLALGWAPDEPAILFPANPARRLKRYQAAQRAVLEAGLREDSLHALVDVTPDQVPLHLNAADVVIITSAWEGGPLTFYEALACGTPVVMAPVGYALDRTWESAYVRVGDRNGKILGAMVRELISGPPPHTRPVDVVIPDAAHHGARVAEIYRALLERT